MLAQASDGHVVYLFARAQSAVMLLSKYLTHFRRFPLFITYVAGLTDHLQFQAAFAFVHSRSVCLNPVWTRSQEHGHRIYAGFCLYSILFTIIT